MTKITQAMVKTYVMTCAWWLIMEQDKTVATEAFEDMLQVLESCETYFFEQGLTLNTLRKLQTIAKKFSLVTMDKLNTEQQLMYNQLIFGPQVKSSGLVDKIAQTDVELKRMGLY